MSIFRKKWILALLLISLLIILFYRSQWLAEMIYPIDYRQDIEVSAGNFNIDPFLIAAIIRVESNYKTDVKSKKGAVGVMQLMPDTAKWVVDQAKYSPDTLQLLHRADVNIEVGAWYLRSLLDQFAGNQTAVIAAYNAGPGNVKKWIQSRVWNGELSDLEQIPFGETRHYIQRVYFYYYKYRSIYAS